MKKSEFRAIVKQCVKECLREVISEQIDPKFTKSLIASAVVGKQLSAQGQTQQRRQQQLLPQFVEQQPMQQNTQMYTQPVQNTISEHDSFDAGSNYISPSERIIFSQAPSYAPAQRQRSNSHLDVPVQRYASPQPPRPQQQFMSSDNAITRSNMTIDSNVMNDILRDTAQTTLLEQARHGHVGPSSAPDGGGQIDASLSDPYLAKLANSDLENHFTGVDRWASLAFFKK